MDRTALLDHGTALYRRGDLPAAARSFAAILVDSPRDAEALSNLAAVCNAREDPVAAEAACREALDASPGYWAALANLGLALHRQDRAEEAVQAYLAAVNANPANAAAWTNLGVVLAGLWRMDGAMIAHNAALKLAPHDPEIRTNRAMALLAAGEYGEGFAEYEWRWRCPTTPHHGLEAPLWLGQPAPGKTILLHEEGGFGDTIQFVRFLSWLAGRDERFILRVQKPLLRLIRRSFPAVETIADDDELPPHDLRCPLMSLPHGLGVRLDGLPGRMPYLQAGAEATAIARGWLSGAAPDALRVGLVWSGAPRLGFAQGRAMNKRRSMDPALLAPLADVRGVKLVSLQMRAAPPAVGGLRMLDPMERVRDFEDTAALVSALDLVISVDSAVAHLAGALGRPVWVMSRHDACWRWLAGRRDSPWYPTLRHYRQAGPGDWRSVVEEITLDLQALAAGNVNEARAP